MIHDIKEKVEQAVKLLSDANDNLKDVLVDIETEYEKGAINRSDVVGYSSIVMGFQMDMQIYAQRFGRKLMKLMQLECRGIEAYCDEKVSIELGERASKDYKTEKLLVK